MGDEADNVLVSSLNVTLPPSLCVTGHGGRPSAPYLQLPSLTGSLQGRSTTAFEPILRLLGTTLRQELHAPCVGDLAPPVQDLLEAVANEVLSRCGLE